MVCLCRFPCPLQAVTNLLPKTIVLFDPQPCLQKWNLHHQLRLSHELQQLIDYIIVIQEAHSSILFDGRPQPVNHLKHPHDLVFDLAFDIRWWCSGNGEEDKIEVLHIYFVSLSFRITFFTSLAVTSLQADSSFLIWSNTSSGMVLPSLP